MRLSGRVVRSRDVCDGYDKNGLKNDPLHLVECDLVVAAIVKFGCARALMRRHLLRVLEQAAVEQIDGDAGRAEAVAAKPSEKPGILGAAN
jgi:hypothetical protein